jgi:hypothetical protein
MGIKDERKFENLDKLIQLLLDHPKGLHKAEIARAHRQALPARRQRAAQAGARPGGAGALDQRPHPAVGGGAGQR